MAAANLTFLCVSSYFKGADFLRACKQAGCLVYLLTAKKLENKPWPHESVDEFFYMEENTEGQWAMNHVIAGLAHVMRSRRIDRIVALDDFDVEKAALLREHFRIPGMGQTTARYFRDKLAMRMKAAEAGINVPPFCALFNDNIIHHYTQTVSPPWVVKPRSEASATGIKKVNSAEQLWDALANLGDKRHHYLVEQFKPGDVYHIDALTLGGKVIFDWCSRYLNTPMEVAHGGGIFRSVTVPFQSKTEKALKKLNAQIMNTFGMRYSASHTEIIHAKEDEQFYFLETASRVGGANIADMVEAASGISLWREWANLEVAMARSEEYQLPEVEKMYSGIIISLCRYENPDVSSFTDTEVTWRINEPHHVGFVVKSDLRDRVIELLENYADRIYRDYHASAPVPDRSAH